MARETLIEERRGRVRLLRMNRPEAKNAFNNRMYLDLAAALAEADADPAVRTLVLTGDGETFSSGQDLSEMNALPESEEIGFEKLLDALQAFGKPLLAAVDGPGLGIGLTLLLHTDLAYLSEHARFKCPFVTLAVAPEAGSSFLLPEVMGHQWSAEFLFTGRWLTAEEAVRHRIALEVLPHDEVLDRTLSTAAQIAEQPPRALRETKALLKAHRMGRVDEARRREVEAFERQLGSPENLEAVRAFFERRAPDFDSLP